MLLCGAAGAGGHQDSPTGPRRRSASCVRIVFLVNVFLLCSTTLTVHGSPLNSFISYFEPVYYDTVDLAGQLSTASRSRRSTSQRAAPSSSSPPAAYNLTFQAHARLFRVQLEAAQRSVFAPDVLFENTLGQIDFQQERIVSGYLEDDSESSVEGILKADGIFDGNILTRGEVFYVEPASRYFESPKDFPVVIYSESDVNHPREGDPHPRPQSVIFDMLPVHRTSLQSIHSVPHSLHFQDGGGRRRRANSTTTRHEGAATRSSLPHEDDGGDGGSNGMSDTAAAAADRPALVDQLYESLSSSSSFFSSDDLHHHRQSSEAQDNAFKSSKHRRSADFGRGGRRNNHFTENKKTTCMLYLQADHLFYKNMGRSEEACIEVMTRHVQRVNSIYRSVDFDMDGKPDNISFMIKRVKVHTDDALEDPGYRFPGNYGVEKFLEIFSEEDYDAFCLAYMFTYRDFEGGTLGLAWTGDLKNAGGVCEKNGHYRGSFKSLNTGVITLLNYGKHVPPAVSHVTMAHEMGHNFGSPHDPETVSECVPGGDEGNYIMFARATSGDKANNKKFSPCSLTSINKVLEAKARGRKGCFREPQMAICGNGVVEEGEECDCGWEEDCLEDCCWPQRTKYSINQIPCTLKQGKQCSPSQGPCCSRDCSYNLGNKCREDNGCRDESYCNGLGTECPPSTLKPNKTVCNQEFVCFLGECTGSICLAYGMESCQCTQEAEDPPTRSCELCCKAPGEGNPCISSFQLNSPPLDIPDMFSKPGTPCDNYQGYCDVFQKCREVDPSGPLATLRKILLSDKSIASLKRFLNNYWYSAVIAAVAVIALMVTIVKFCGKKTPLVHRRRRKRRTVHHTAEVDEEMGRSLPPPEVATVHPTATKSQIPFLGKRYKMKRETSRDKSRSKDKSRKSSKVADAKEATRENAGNLARGLTQLIVALPPENPESSAGGGGSDDHRPKLKKRSQSVEENSSRNRSTSATAAAKLKKQKTLGHMKKLSKSATTLSKSFEKLNSEEKDRKRSKSRDKHRGGGREKPERQVSAPADQQHTEPREVTIAKLGPFKMSLELRDAGNPTSPPPQDKSKPVSSQKTRRRKSGNTTGKEMVRQKSETRKEAETAAVSTAALTASAATVAAKAPKLKRESSRDRDASKIIVSKLAKSDRPRREKSPEKRRESRHEPPTSSDDYRLSLNKRTGGGGDIKFNRSISQPNPPPDFSLDELAVVRERGSKTMSRSQGDRISAVNRKQLKRSSTTREQQSVSPLAEEEAVMKSNTLRPSSNRQQQRADVHVFDNLGFDKSPDSRSARQRKPSSHSISELREQLETQLRKEKLKQSSNYSLMERSSLSDSSVSDSSEDKRKSPPTQTQSLSEESSSTGGASRRTTRADSFCAGFDSSDDSDLSEPGGEGGRSAGAAGRRQQAMPPFAANPYVRVPPAVLSLQPGSSLKGCDNEDMVAGKVTVRDASKDKTGEVYEDGDTLSILTDGMAPDHPDFTSV